MNHAVKSSEKSHLWPSAVLGIVLFWRIIGFPIIIIGFYLKPIISLFFQNRLYICFPPQNRLYRFFFKTDYTLKRNGKCFKEYGVVATQDIPRGRTICDLKGAIAITCTDINKHSFASLTPEENSNIALTALSRANIDVKRVRSTKERRH